MRAARTCDSKTAGVIRELWGDEEMQTGVGIWDSTQMICKALNCRGVIVVYCQHSSRGQNTVLIAVTSFSSVLSVS